MLTTSAVIVLVTGCAARMNDSSDEARIYFSHSSPTIIFDDKFTREVDCNSAEPKGLDTVGASVSRAQLVLYFLNDKSTLGASEIERLQSFVLASMDAPSVSYLITGHTDSLHTDMYNAQLSIRRAEKVLSSMIHMGVPINQLAITAAGETAPVASNRTAEGRQLNRRVTVEIISAHLQKDHHAELKHNQQAYEGRIPTCLALASGGTKT